MEILLTTLKAVMIHWKQLSFLPLLFSFSLILGQNRGKPSSWRNHWYRFYRYQPGHQSDVGTLSDVAQAC